MELQVALDRLGLEEAVRIAAEVAPHADRIEVGTSLIKEFGVSSIRRLRRAVPDHRLVADIKTVDNSAYEFGLCFAAGADTATVMGSSPMATVQACADLAQAHGREVLIDLLGTDADRQAELLAFRDAIFGVHLGKDQQETGRQAPAVTALVPAWADRRRVAVAGGIRLGDIAALARHAPDLIVIVGSAITGAVRPAAAAKAFASALTDRPAHRREP